MSGLASSDNGVSFEDYVSKCFESTIGGILGNDPLKALDARLLKDFGLGMDTIYVKAEMLPEFLERFFGKGARVIIRVFIRNLFRGLGIQHNSTSDLRRDLTIAKEKFEQPTRHMEAG